MVRGSLIDHSRVGRVVPLKMYYPVEHSLTNLPVIVWSHGLGGSADGAAFLSRYLASYGFIILHVQHHGTDSGLWEGKPGHPWDIIKATHIPRSMTLARFGDIPFALDNLEDWLKAEHPDVLAMADLKNLGMSGHSFGAMTTQVMMGEQFPDEEGILRDYSDSRFKAGILYSPVPAFHLSGSLPDNVYHTINRPLFHMTGTDDSSPVEGFGYETRLAVYEHSRAEKYLMILKDGDHMVYNGSRGKLGANPNRHTHEAIIKTAALAFWQGKLKNDQTAMDWLTNGGFSTYLGDDGTFQFEKPV